MAWEMSLPSRGAWVEMAYIKELTGCGVIMPDADLEDYARQIAKLPERMELRQFDMEARAQQRRETRERQDAELETGRGGQDIDTEEIAPEDDEVAE